MQPNVKHRSYTGGSYRLTRVPGGIGLARVIRERPWSNVVEIPNIELT